MNTPEVRRSEAYEKNWNDWNDIQNSYNIRCSDPDLKYPKSLLSAAWKEFLGFAKEYHIDPSAYQWAEVSKMDDVTWQVDFHCTDDSTGPHIAVYDIYYNSRNRQIMQRCIVAGQ